MPATYRRTATDLQQARSRDHQELSEIGVAQRRLISCAKRCYYVRGSREARIPLKSWAAGHDKYAAGMNRARFFGERIFMATAKADHADYRPRRGRRFPRDSIPNVYDALKLKDVDLTSSSAAARDGGPYHCHGAPEASSAALGERHPGPISDLWQGPRSAASWTFWASRRTPR